MHAIFRRILVAGSLLFLAGPAPAADSIPPLETGTAKVTTRLVNGEFEMREVGSNSPIIAMQHLPVLAGMPRACNPRLEVQQQPTGADLILRLNNTSGSRQKLGLMSIGILNLGRDIEFFDFRHNSRLATANWDTYPGLGWQYPSDLYSPVAVLRNGRYAIGVSMQYPILEYKHDVRVGIGAPHGQAMVGPAGKGWNVEFRLANFGDETADGTIQNEAWMAPGESRVYVVSVRVTTQTDQWQHTLLPYRDYFRAMYGGVKYQRHDDPILGFSMADLTLLSSSNPYGYRNDLRPDLNGWQRTVTLLDQSRGWNTVMLWSPTGLYRTHREFNYPFQMASQWMRDPESATVVDPMAGLRGVTASGRQLGLWWGRSMEYSDRWDPTRTTPLDPDNPVHVAAAHAEMDVAVQAGVTVVGLDTFSATLAPLWKLKPWLEHLQERYPGVRFCTEPTQCDILHTVAPTLVDGWQILSYRPRSRDEYFTLKNPDYLADLLLPGHETWASFTYHQLKTYFGTPTSLDVARDMHRFADMGYTPVFFAQASIPPDIRAAWSWETTVPEDIRTTDEMAKAFREGRLVNGAIVPPEGVPEGSTPPTPPPPPPASAPPPPSPAVPPIVLNPMGRAIRVLPSTRSRTTSGMMTMRGSTTTSGSASQPPQSPRPPTTPRRDVSGMDILHMGSMGQSRALHITRVKPIDWVAWQRRQAGAGNTDD